MAITMQDIQDEGFEHALRGYDVGQVDVFLERVANEVDAMNKQIADLESQLKEAKDELAKTRGELAEANAEALASPDELEQANLVERELRSELEVVKERLAAATARAEEAEAKIEPMQERLEEKKSLDNAIAEAFIAAQRSAAQIKEDARIEGNRIYRESEAKAREFIRESLAKKAAIDNEIKALSEYFPEVPRAVPRHARALHGTCQGGVQQPRQSGRDRRGGRGGASQDRHAQDSRRRGFGCRRRGGRRRREGRASEALDPADSPDQHSRHPPRRGRVGAHMRLPVHVTPKSGRGEVIGWRDGADGQRELEVKVKAAPEKGKATKEAIALIASFFDVPKSSVTCVRGETSRHKMFEVPDSVGMDI